MKPAEILYLEKLYGFELREVNSKTLNHMNHCYVLNEKNQITHLDLSHSKITEIKGLDNLKQLKELYLNSNQILEIKGLDNLKELKELYLYSNQITEIKGLEKLCNLNILYLNNNKIIEIKGLDKLNKLQKLHLSLNKITEIKGLSKLINLNNLYLSTNRITEIKGLDNLIKLNNLQLYFNEVTEIKGLDKLINLNNLDLHSNRITEVKGLNKLINLYYLNLSSNQITEISNLYNILLKQKINLVLSENPIYQKVFSLPKYSIYNQYDAFLKYLSDENEKQKKENITLPVKVLLLGNHSSGKSTLVEHFFKIENKNESTHILNIHRYYKVKNKTGSTPYAMFYDFGGQDYYHGIYQAFLSLDSINLILWQSSTNKNNIRKSIDGTENYTRNFTKDYWLHQLNYSYRKRKINLPEILGTHAQSLFLIQTHADSENSIRESGCENFDEFTIVNEHYISLNEEKIKSNKVFKSGLTYLYDSLIQKIEEKSKKAKQLDYYNDFLNFILASENGLCISLEDDILKHEYYKRKKMDGESDAHILHFLKLDLYELSRKGMVLYYYENEKLNNVVWLNPTKTIEYIHDSILSKDFLKDDHKGSIPKDKFEPLCTDERIKELLLEEKVIFYDNAAEEYIIPGYLPLSEKDEYFDILKFGFIKPNFILKFQHFIPFGLINQLICFYGKLPDKKKYWRDQLIFTYNNSYKVWIKLDFSSLTIYVYINAINDTNPSLKLNELEKIIFLNIIDLYWGNNINEFEPVGSSKELEDVQRKYIKLHTEKERVQKETLNIDDLYISVDNKYFVHQKELNETDQNIITVYPLDKETNNINISTHKTQRTYLYRNFTNNKNLNTMKKIFISYSREDIDYKNELKKQLQMLKHFDIADNWSCEQIQIGKWDEQIQKELEESDLIIYMLSANFFTSKYILDKEVAKGLDDITKNPDKKALCVIVSDFVGLDKLKVALENHEKTDLQESVLQLSDWQYLPYGNVLNKVTDNNMEKIIPLKRHPYAELAYTQVCEKILELFND